MEKRLLINKMPKLSALKPYKKRRRPKRVSTRIKQRRKKYYKQHKTQVKKKSALWRKRHPSRIKKYK